MLAHEPIGNINSSIISPTMQKHAKLFASHRPLRILPLGDKTYLSQCKRKKYALNAWPRYLCGYQVAAQ